VNPALRAASPKLICPACPAVFPCEDALKLFHFVFVFFSFAVLATSCAFAQTYPAPYLNEPLVPTSAAPGGAAFVLTVNGSGFVSGAGVKWNGVALTTTFVNQNQLTAQVPGSKIAKAGTVYITVSNPIGGGTSNSVAFNIAQPTSSLAWKTVNTSTTAGSPGVVADFNGDGIPDLAAISSESGLEGTVAIFLGLGNGSFSARPQLTTPKGFPHSILAADFNQDGKMDLAVLTSPNCMGCAEVMIFLGNGDGTFNLAYESFGLDGEYVSLVVGDFNGDGKPDFAVSMVDGGPPQVSVYLGVGDGTFAAEGYVNDEGCYAMGNVLLTGDYNRDGILDTAVVGETCLQSGDSLFPLAIFFGDGQGVFNPAGSQPVTTWSGWTLAADFDSDGILDLCCGPNLEILHGNGDGTFTQIGGGTTANVSPTAVSDLNGDGKLDLIAGNSVYLGNGNGTFQNALTIPAPPNSAFLGVADFNGDGHPDLSFTTSQGISVLLQQSSLPVAQFSTNVLSFGKQPMNVTSAPMEMFLLNSGSAPLNLSSIAVAGPNSGDFTQSNNCGKVLVAGARCKFYVTFTPLALGQRSAALRIMDNAAKSTQGVPLFGTGVAAH
jgi:hypothetical protein